MQYLYIFVGGALGALIRFCLSMLNEGQPFRWEHLLQIYWVLFNGQYRRFKRFTL